MQINNQFLSEYYHDIAVRQLEQEYESKGYHILKKYNIGNYLPDIAAKKDNQVIIIEVKTGKLSKDKQERLKQISDFVNSKLNHQFKIVFANPPKEKQIQIDDIDNLLQDWLSNDLPSELDQLSTHSSIDEISDLDIEELILSSNGDIEIKGSAVISVNLQFGSDSEQDDEDGGYSDSASFPLVFELTLNFAKPKHHDRSVSVHPLLKNIMHPHPLEIKKCSKLEIDTSSYYED